LTLTSPFYNSKYFKIHVVMGKGNEQYSVRVNENCPMEVLSDEYGYFEVEIENRGTISQIKIRPKENRTS